MSETVVAIWSGIGTGIFSSTVVAYVAYRVGRKDSSVAEHNIALSLVSLRLREMSPTSRERPMHGYGTEATAHWLICVSEILGEAGFIDTSRELRKLSEDIDSALTCDQPPTKEQKEQGEARKSEWKRRVHKFRK